MEICADGKCITGRVFLDTWACQWNNAAFLALINPFIIGAYLLGIVALLNLKYCRRKAYRITFFLLYCIVATCTLVAVMGMTHWWELLMYVPHLIILILAMILVSHRIGSKVKS